MKPCPIPCALALCALLAACTISTPGSQATPKGQADCVAAAARHFKVSSDNIRVDGSQMSTSSDIYDVLLSNATTGRRAKCTVDQNGIVLGVIELR